MLEFTISSEKNKVIGPCERTVDTRIPKQVLYRRPAGRKTVNLERPTALTMNGTDKF